MNSDRFHELTARYARQSIAVIGDFCLDRYLEIDPAQQEISIETGLPVHNVMRVRSQAGAAGTILNNLVALGVGALLPVGFCGEDGEGYELRRALAALSGVRLEHFLQTPERRTFTYCKPLLLTPGHPPQELSRLDSKNWTTTPAGVMGSLALSVRALARSVDAIILMDQVDLPETGVVTRTVREAVSAALQENPKLIVLADSRRRLGEFPPLGFKMNATELAALCGEHEPLEMERIQRLAGERAQRHGQPLFVTLAERGIVGANKCGEVEHVPAFPLRGPIDIVGAGDSVMANLTTALAAGASLREAMELAMAAASLTIHQLGTTGTASVDQLATLMLKRI